MVVLMELTQKSWGYSWELSCNQSHGWTITLVVRWFSQLFSAQWENSIHSFPCLMIPEAIAKDRGYSSFCLLDKPISTAHGKTRMSNLKFAFASVFLSSFTPIFCDIFPDRIKTIAIPHFFYWIILQPFASHFAPARKPLQHDLQAFAAEQRLHDAWAWVGLLEDQIEKAKYRAKKTRRKMQYGNDPVGGVVQNGQWNGWVTMSYIYIYCMYIYIECSWE